MKNAIPELSLPCLCSHMKLTGDSKKDLTDPMKNGLLPK